MGKGEKSLLCDPPDLSYDKEGEKKKAEDNTWDEKKTEKKRSQRSISIFQSNSMTYCSFKSLNLIKCDFYLFLPSSYLTQKMMRDG